MAGDLSPDVAAREAAAAARSLAAAERAVAEGRLNLAKVLRAHAAGARQRALLLARIAGDAHLAADDVAGALDAARATMAALDDDPDPIAAIILRSAESAEQLLVVTEEALADGRDVPETSVAQLLFACETCGLILESSRPEVCPSCGSIGGEFTLFAPFFAGTPDHLARREPQEILVQLHGDAARMAAALHADDTVLRRPIPGGDWCAKEIAGHMVDIVELACRRVSAAVTGEEPPPERSALPWKLLETEDYANTPGSAIADRFTASLAELVAMFEALSPAGWRKRVELVTGRTLLIDVGSWVANHNTAHLEQLRAAVQ